MGTVVLCRHGETTWNRDGRVQGWAPSDLTDRGRREAAALADAVARDHDVDRLLGSDLPRAVETGRYLRRTLGLDYDRDAAWRERDFGRLQGFRAEELFEGRPEFAAAETGYTSLRERPPGGETLLECRERVLAAWRGLGADLGPEETAVVVTHGGPLYLLVGHLRGLDVVTALLEGGQGNCARNVVEVDADGSGRILAENVPLDA